MAVHNKKKGRNIKHQMRVLHIGYPVKIQALFTYLQFVQKFPHKVDVRKLSRGELRRHPRQSPLQVGQHEL